MLDSWFHSDDLLSALKLGYKWGRHTLKVRNSEVVEDLVKAIYPSVGHN